MRADSAFMLEYAPITKDCFDSEGPLPEEAVEDVRISSIMVLSM